MNNISIEYVRNPPSPLYPIHLPPSSLSFLCPLISTPNHSNAPSKPSHLLTASGVQQLTNCAANHPLSTASSPRVHSSPTSRHHSSAPGYGIHSVLISERSR